MLSILKNDLRQALRDRGLLVMLFLMPLAFILPISFALGGGDGYGAGQHNRRQRLPLAVYDEGPHAQKLITALEESLSVERSFSAGEVAAAGLQADPSCAQPDAPACSERVAGKLVEQSQRAALLVIPAGFSAAIDAGQKTAVTLRYDPVGDSARRQLIEGVVRGSITELALTQVLGNSTQNMKDLVVFAPAPLRSSILENAAQQEAAGSDAPAFAFKDLPPSSFTRPQYPDTYQQTVPGYTVMYVFFIISYLSASIREEKLNGTFRRLLAMPLRRSTLLGGKMLASLVIGLLQVTVMFAAGALVFGLDLGASPVGLILLTVALVTAATCMGLAAASSALGGVIIPLLIISALLGGCMFPVDLMPLFLRSLSYAMPHSWALNGYQALMVRGQGLAQILPNAGVLFLFAAVFFYIGVRRFEFDD